MTNDQQHILDCFAQRADVLRRHIANVLERERIGLAAVSPWADDVLPRLSAFAARGKLIRGNLVLFGTELGGSTPSAVAFDLAAALELFHSSILVHDDIIDQDAFRRGMPTMHTAYADRLRAEHRPDPAHIGASLAICAGDIGYYLVFAILAESAKDADCVRALSRFWATEFAKVALAEMDDVYLSLCDGPVAEADILRFYRFKTARYTFCLPLLTGLKLADAPASLCAHVEQIADRLGLVFQLKDDELGLFGRQEETGKPVGSDIAQNKKTLYHHWLLTRTTPGMRAQIAPLFGKKSLTQDEVALVQRVAVDSGARKMVDEMMARMTHEAQELIAALPVPEALRAGFRQLGEYSLARTT